MAEYEYTKGYLAIDDLDWDVNEFLQGSENINDCYIGYYDQGGANEASIAAFATDADVVFIWLDDSNDINDNALAGYCSLSGGFLSVAMAGDGAIMVSASDPTKIYAIQFSSLTGGNDTGSMALYITAGDDVESTQGETIDGTDYAYYARGNSENRVHVRNVGTADDHETAIGDGTDSPIFLKGKWDGNLYAALGGLVHVKYAPDEISGDSWAFDTSYGYVGDDFAGTSRDTGKWYEVDDGGNMVSCFSQSNGLEIDTNSAAGASHAYWLYLAFCAGNMGVQVRFTASTWPAVGVGENVYVALELTSQNEQEQLRIIRGRKPIVFPATHEQYLRFEVVKAGAVDYEYELYDPGDDLTLRVERRDPDVSGKKIAFMVESTPGSGVWDSYYYDYASGSDSPRLPRIYVYNDTGSALQGDCYSFTASANAPEVYTDLPDEEIEHGGVSPLLTDDERVIALAFADGSAHYIRTDETSEGGGTSEATAEVSNDAAGLGNSIDLLCAAVAYDGKTCFFSGDGGVCQVDCSAAKPVLLRNYDRTYDHAQPLTWTDVLCIDALEDAGGFIYGTEVSYTTSGDSGVYGDSGDPGGSGGVGGLVGAGGGGWITPDFTAPEGSDAWARARNSDEINAGANSPDPEPVDYLHAHIERRIDNGSWYRLKSTGWTLYSAPGWVHSTDVCYLNDATLGDAGTVMQDENLSDGVYEYRWVYHDEAGNQSEEDCVTAYGDDCEYIDTPSVVSITLNSGVSPTTERGIEVEFTVNSGSDTGELVDKVYQVKVWNDGENEADSAWTDYSSSDTYYHKLTSGDGIKTVRAKARHTNGLESAQASRTIELDTPAAATDPSYDHENIIICCGEDADYNFTSDDATITAYNADSEDSDFPMENLQNYDLGSVWKTSDIGVTTNMGSYFLHEWGLDFDLGSAKKIDVFAILNHNFAEMYNSIPGVYDFELLLYSSTDNVVWVSTVDLTDLINHDEIVHRNPRTILIRYWRLYCKCKTHAVSLSVDSWQAGRIIFNETALCYQPGSNFEYNADVGWNDPSDVNLNQGGSRRVNERDEYRVARFPFKLLSESNHQDLVTIWRRQRSKRPVLILKDPHNICAGTTTPSADDTYTAIYGWMDESFNVKDRVNNYGDVVLTIHEARG